MEFGPFVEREEFDHNMECYCAEHAVDKLEENMPFYDSGRLLEGICYHVISLNFALHRPG